MKKRIISVFALLLCVCFSFSGCDSLTAMLSGANDSIDYKIENGEAIVTGAPNKSTVTKIVIPDEYEGVPVTKIADFAAQNLEYVTEIYIGKNVKEIGTWALENNQRVTAFEVDESNPYFCDVDGVLFTKDMKTLLFYPAAKDLEDAVDEDGNIIEDENGNIIKVSEYTIPDGVEIIRTKAFYKCNKLIKIEFPETVTKIEEKAFFRCDSMKEFILPNSLSFIGKDAFSYCNGLTEITIPSSVTQIDEYAFYNCTNLLTVNMEAKESDLTLGEKWFPTNNGLDIKELTINWK